MALLLAPRALRRLPQLVQTSVRRTHKRGGECTEEEACRPHPCCAPPPPRLRDLRVKCTPPLTGKPPPCAPPPQPPERTCQNVRTKPKEAKEIKSKEYVETVVDVSCGAQLDAVTLRLAAAERQRRRAYERETAVCEPPPPADFSTYCLAAETATDIPPICPTEDSSINCEINREKHIDPCAHNPRIIVEIDRSDDAKKSHSSHDVCSEPVLPTIKSSRGTEGLTTRIMEKFKRSSNKVSQETNPPPHGSEPSLVKRLCRKPGDDCGPNTPSKRGLHTTVVSCGTTIESELNIKKYNKDWFTQIPREVNQPKNAKRNDFLDLSVPQSTDTESTVRYSSDSNFEMVSPPISLFSREDSWLSLKNIKKKMSSFWKQDVCSPKTSASTNNSNLQETEVVHTQSPCDQSHTKQIRQSIKRCPPKVKCWSSDSHLVNQSTDASVPVSSRHLPKLLLLSTV